MTRAYLIRHGETDWNRDRICMGQMDLPLNERGRRQAALIADRLAHAQIDAVYSSDLSRAMGTAAPLARARGLIPTAMKELRELDYGTWQGYRQEELRERFPETFREDPRRQPMRFQPHGGESVSDLYRRSVQAFEEILERHRGQTTTLVAHGGTIRCLVNHVLDQGAPPHNGSLFSLRFAIDNASISLVREQEGGSLQIAYLNDICHLGGEGDSSDERSGSA